MDWRIAVLAGAGGGLIVAAVAFLADLNEYRQARRTCRATGKPGPRWGGYFDPWPDAAAAATRLVLGAASGGIFHSQVSSTVAAVAVGAAAPALFGQLNSARSMGELADPTEEQPE
ncbi:hypothetical protein [Nocardia wallacei]|uniref:hypothetical protein n=1 Tax=Nocardia wallacei TaxID=480035 RepID=UPI002453E2B9|nr:hypothetical protein [Nocardia wallacei]